MIYISTAIPPNNGLHGTYKRVLPRNITTPIEVRVLRSRDEEHQNHVDVERDSKEEECWVRGVAFESFICPTTSRLIYVV